MLTAQTNCADARKYIEYIVQCISSKGGLLCCSPIWSLSLSLCRILTLTLSVSPSISLSISVSLSISLSLFNLLLP